MKPIIIFPRGDEETVSMSKEELKEYIVKAYNEGYADGYEKGCSFFKNTSPLIP